MTVSLVVILTLSSCSQPLLSTLLPERVVEKFRRGAEHHRVPHEVERRWVVQTLLDVVDDLHETRMEIESERYLDLIEWQGQTLKSVVSNVFETVIRYDDTLTAHEFGPFSAYSMIEELRTDCGPDHRQIMVSQRPSGEGDVAP